MSGKIMKFALVIVLLTTGLFACAKADPKPEPEPEPEPEVNEEVELSASFLGSLGNTGGNLSNGGYYAESNGWLYFADPLNFGRLTKMKSDGSDKKMLDRDFNVGMINVIGDWIYYGPEARFGSAPIVRIKTDGSLKEIIINDMARKVIAKGNYLYYLTNTLSLVRSKTDGTEATVLAANVVEFALSGRWLIYYESNKELKKIRLDGKYASKLNDKGCLAAMFGDEQAVYCPTESGIRMIKTDGSLTKEIQLGEKPYGLNMTQEGFVYSTYDSVIKVNLEGKERLVLSTTKGATSINLAENWLYFTDSYEWENFFRVTLDGETQETITDALWLTSNSSAPKLTDLLAQRGSWVLLIDGWTYHALTTATLAKTKGTQQETVYPYEINSMVQVGDWLYFTEWVTTFTKALSRIKTDGTQYGRLTKDDVLGFYIKEDWIYYTHNNGHLYRMKTNGSSDAELTSDRIASWVIEGDWIYYSVGSGSSGSEGVESTFVSSDIKRMALDGSMSQQIYSGSVWGLASDGYGLYFKSLDGDKSSLWSIGYDGLGAALIKDDVRYIETVAPGWIYTTTSTTDRLISIIRIKTDGSITETLVALASDHTMIQVIGDKVYYIDHANGEIQIHRMNLDGSDQQLIVS